MIKMYYSGHVPRISCEEYILENGLSRLISYAYKKDIEVFMGVAKRMSKRPDLMLDSGAFTAWSKGEQVNIDQFISFARDLQQRDVNLTIINLDKIPGAKGRDPTTKELKEAVIMSAKNHGSLVKSLGNKNVLPVYHQGEPVNVLQDIVATGATYICLSPRNDVQENARVNWCNTIFKHVPEHIKSHGLATTGRDMMKSNAWHSVDSATYIMVAAYGGIFWGPRFSILPISQESSMIKEANKHYDTLPDLQQRLIRSEMLGHGFSVEDLRTDYGARTTWNIMLMNLHAVLPTQRNATGLFT